MYVREKVTGVTVAGVRGHLVAVEAHVGRGSSFSAGSCRQAVANGVGRYRSTRALPEPLPAETYLSRIPSVCSRGFLNRESQVRFLPGARDHADFQFK